MEKHNELCSQHAKIEAIIENISKLLEEQRVGFSQLLERLARQEELLSQFVKTHAGLEERIDRLEEDMKDFKGKLDKFEGALTLLKISLSLFAAAGGISLLLGIVKVVR